MTEAAWMRLDASQRAIARNLAHRLGYRSELSFLFALMNAELDRQAAGRMLTPNELDVLIDLEAALDGSQSA